MLLVIPGGKGARDVSLRFARPGNNLLKDYIQGTHRTAFEPVTIMARYIFNRLVLMVGILFGVLTITFLLGRALPADPAALILGDRPTAEQIERANRELGLDKSLLTQYLHYFGGILQGDFGDSLRTRRPVVEEIGKRIGATLELTTLSVVLVVLIGVPLGVISAVRQNSLIDNMVRAGAVAGVAMPAFMLAMVLQIVFHGQLNLMPLQGRIDAVIALDQPFPTVTGLYLIDSLLAGNRVAFQSTVSHLILPVLTLTIVTLATVTRITRNMMVETLSEEYIHTARAYGVPPRKIHYSYALRATLIPMLTVVGLTYGYLLGGAIVVEFVFDWPGLGGFVVFSIMQNDFPAAIGATLVLAGAYLLINLIVDLLYFVVDPRLQRS